MIVISGAHSERFKFFGNCSELLAKGFPSIQSRDARPLRHHDVFASDDLIQLNRLLQPVFSERWRVVVCGIASNTGIVHDLSRQSRRFWSPVCKVGIVKLDDLISLL